MIPPLADPWGAAGARHPPPPPPTGSNSVVFAYIFAEKCMCQRSEPLNGSAPPPPPTGNTGSATDTPFMRKSFNIKERANIILIKDPFLTKKTPHIILSHELNAPREQDMKIKVFYLLSLLLKNTHSHSLPPNFSK